MHVVCRYMHRSYPQSCPDPVDRSYKAKSQSISSMFAVHITQNLGQGQYHRTRSSFSVGLQEVSSVDRPNLTFNRNLLPFWDFYGVWMTNEKKLTLSRECSLKTHSTRLCETATLILYKRWLKCILIYKAEELYKIWNSYPVYMSSHNASGRWQRHFFLLKPIRVA